MNTRKVRVDFKGHKGNLVSVDLTVQCDASRVAIHADAVRKLSAETRRLINLNCIGMDVVDMELQA